MFGIRFFRTFTFVLLCGTLSASCKSDQPQQWLDRAVLLSGASFAVSSNGWFESGCELLDATPVNRAVSGESIVDCAGKMKAGTLYNRAELEKIDVFVVMHVHNRDVCTDGGCLRDDLADYEFPLDRDNYAGAYDYVIRKYIEDCHNLQFDSISEYYGNGEGKPAVIVLCTHWHDGRGVFNSSIRQLAAKWGLPLVEFDSNIGFSKEFPDPFTGEQYSCSHSADREEIDGVRYGWHPYPGNSDIQRRLSEIFTAAMRQIEPFR